MNACFSGGCFWCVTPIYKLYGVDRVVCGYSGGDEENPRYQDVKAQRTGHREAILLEYDPEKVNYDRLLDIYFANVDPFDRAGEREIALEKLAELEQSAGKRVCISVEPFRDFWMAEEYHQDYYLKNPEAFEEEMIRSGRKGAGNGK